MNLAVTTPSSRRRVLIVSPNFPPINAPDMQRARVALPFLREQGWEPVVLAVTPESSGTGVLEPLLEQTYPADIRVIRVQGILPGRTRWLGLGSLWWRCGAALRQAGDAVLAGEKFDLVFFTTTQFDAFTLGPRWRQRFGVPYVLDYQDPWINSYYHRTNTRPPGGWLKFNLTQWLARRREPAVVRQAAAVVAVSGAYTDSLAAAYPGVDVAKFHILPFGAAPADFAVAAQQRPARPLIDFDDGNVHQVYTGRAGPDMAFALTRLFRAFRRYRDSHPAEAERLRFHFIGTGYAPPPGGREWVMPIARAEGVASAVHEHCYRVPYFDALYYLLKAHALMVIGSNDSTYTASKLLPCVLAHRPMLVLFHRDSPGLKVAREIGLEFAFGFTDPEDGEALADAVYTRWFAGGGHEAAFRFDPEAFQQYSAAALAGRLAGVFNGATRNPRRPEPDFHRGH